MRGHWEPGIPPTETQPAETPQQEFEQAAGFSLYENFNGNSLKGTIRGIQLVEGGTAEHDTAVVKTLIHPGKQFSTAYDCLASGDKIASDGSIPFGDASLFVLVSGYGPLPGFGIANIAGTDDLTNGWRIRTNVDGDALVDVRIGGVATTFSLPEAIKPNTWFDVGILVSRLAGMAGVVRVATKTQQMEKPLGAGSLQSTEPLTIGALSGSGAWLGQIMAVRVAIDAVGDVLADVQPISVLQDAAKFTTWAPVYAGVIENSDTVDVRYAAVPRRPANATMVHGETVEEQAIDNDFVHREKVLTIVVTQQVLAPFVIPALNTPVVWEGYRTTSSTTPGFIDDSTPGKFVFLEPLHSIRSQLNGSGLRSAGGSATYVVSVGLFDSNDVLVGVFPTSVVIGGSGDIEYRLDPETIVDLGGMVNGYFQQIIEKTAGAVPDTITPLAFEPTHGPSTGSVTTIRGSRPV